MFQWLAYEYINVMTNSILGSKCNDNFAISKVSLSNCKLHVKILCKRNFLETLLYKNASARKLDMKYATFLTVLNDKYWPAYTKIMQSYQFTFQGVFTRDVLKLW